MSKIWKSICTSAEAQKANLIAKTIGSRLLHLTPNDPVFKMRHELQHFQLIDYSALAILYRALHQTFGDLEYKLMAEKNLSYAIFDSVPIHNFALLNGLSQLGMAALLSFDGSVRHEHLLLNIDTQVHLECLRRCRLIRELPPGHQLQMSDYDVVSGISGVIGYLLMRRSNSSVEATLMELVSTLISVILPRDETELNTRSFTTRLAEHFGGEDGLINCGLAHGMPGVLIALSLALSINLEVDGLRDSVRLLAKWLEQKAVSNGGYASWTYKVAKESQSSNEPLHLSHNGWCYGAPGVLRAIWLAGEALDDVSHKTFASDGVSRLFSSPQITNRQNGNSICHGLAGRLLIAMRFYNNTGLESIRLGATVLLDQILAEFQGNYRFGFREPILDDALVDDPGLVTGAAGIALVLLAAASDIEPTWDRLLMVS